jgi:hypothetical protein
MSTPGTQPQAAGWYPDPAGSGGQRWHDGQGWTGQVVHGSPHTRELGAGFARLADWLGRGLVLSGVVGVVGALGFALIAMDPPDVVTSPGTAGFAAGGSEGSPAGQLLLIVYSFASLLVLATQIVWLVWQYQVAAAAPVRLKRSPGMNVVWWFVPLANMVVPRLAIGELWHAFSTRRRGAPAEPTPVVFSVWWALWISPLVLVPLMVVAMLDAATPEAAVSSIFWMFALVLLGQAGAGLAARSVVRALSWRALLYYAASP